MLVAGALLGFYVRDPLNRLLKRRQEVIDATRARFTIQVIPLSLAPALRDLSGTITRENGRQGLFEFAFDESPPRPRGAELEALENAPGKRGFTEAVSRICEAGGELVGGGPGSPSGRFEVRRGVVITGVPIPGNFYAWNTPNRGLLMISTASVEGIIAQHEDVSLDDFVVRIVQRMAIFSVVPELDPLRTHVRYSKGCIFDFTVYLDRIPDLLREPRICPDCQQLIAKAQGDRFAIEAREWVECSLADSPGTRSEQ